MSDGAGWGYDEQWRNSHNKDNGTVTTMVVVVVHVVAGHERVIAAFRKEGFLQFPEHNVPRALQDVTWQSRAWVTQWTRQDVITRQKMISCERGYSSIGLHSFYTRP